jgi:hypothetical protein
MYKLDEHTDREVRILAEQIEMVKADLGYFLLEMNKATHAVETGDEQLAVEEIIQTANWHLSEAMESLEELYDLCESFPSKKTAH